MKFSLLISPIDFAWGNSKAHKPFSLYLPKTTGVHTYLSYKKINLIIEQKIQILKVLSTLILIYCYETKLPLSLNYSEVFLEEIITGPKYFGPEYLDATLNIEQYLWVQTSKN